MNTVGVKKPMAPLQMEDGVALKNNLKTTDITVKSIVLGVTEMISGTPDAGYVSYSRWVKIFEITWRLESN